MYKALIIISSLFALINSQCVPEEDDLLLLGKLRDYEDCERRTTTAELEETSTYKCCHLYYEQETNNIYKEVDTCILITHAQYDDIKNYLDELESYYGIEKTKIHCFGSYIQFSLLILLLSFL